MSDQGSAPTGVRRDEPRPQTGAYPSPQGGAHHPLQGGAYPRRWPGPASRWLRRSAALLSVPAYRRRLALVAAALLTAAVLLAFQAVAPRTEPVRVVPAPVFELPVEEWPAPSGPAGATGGPTEEPARPRLLPPRPLPAPTVSAPVRPGIALAQTSVPGLVDLTSVGPVDWVHWGLRDPRSVNRKAGGSGAIVDQRGPGGRGRYDNNPQRFGWRDGAPERSVGASPTGVYNCGEGNGFAIAVDAGPATRTLRFYAGVWRAQGRLELSLSSGGPTASTTLTDQRSNGNAVFTVRFQAPAGSRLLVRWTTERSFDRQCGNVNLQAAALS